MTIGLAVLPLLFIHNAFADNHKNKSKRAIKAEDKIMQKNFVTVYTYQALATDEDCWATFYDKDNYKGANLTLAGKHTLGDVDFDLKPYTLGGDPDSVKVGSKATLYLYGDEDYKDLDYTIKPNAELAKLKKIPVWDDIESVRLTCSK